MEPRINFHQIDRLAFTPVQEYQRSEEGKPPFWARDLRIEGDGGTFIMSLFSDTAEGLLLPSERNPPAPPKCGQCGVVVDPDYRHQCDIVPVV